MIFNEAKTKIMLAIGKRLDKRLENQQLQAKLNGPDLEQVLSRIFKYLSFYYNSNVKVATCAIDTQNSLPCSFFLYLMNTKP